MITCKRPCNWAGTYKLQALCFKQDIKHVKGLSGPRNQLTLCGCHGKQQINGTMCFTNNE